MFERYICMVYFCKHVPPKYVIQCSSDQCWSEKHYYGTLTTFSTGVKLHSTDLHIYFPFSAQRRTVLLAFI